MNKDCYGINIFLLAEYIYDATGLIDCYRNDILLQDEYRLQHDEYKILLRD